jgi:hypothetical protein
VAQQVKMFIGDKEIKGIDTWKINTVPWYKRWYFKWKLNRAYREHRKATT